MQIFPLNLKIRYNYSMISVRKIHTFLLIILFSYTECISSIFAMETIIHSWIELPSIRNTMEISELLEERKKYETTQEMNIDFEEKNIPPIIQAREMYIASTHIENITTMTPWFITDPFRRDVFLTENILHGFLENSGGPSFVNRWIAWASIQKEWKVKSTRWIIRANIKPNTIIRTATWVILPESLLTIESLDSRKKIRAQRQFEARTIDGNQKISKTVDSEGFEFGLSGTHLIFSEPIAITIDTPYASDGITIDLMTMHAGDTMFHTGGLSVDPATQCSADGMASIPWSQAIVQWWKFTFYTCGASSFTFNIVGWTTTSNDLKLVIGDYGQAQVYYKWLPQIFGGSPPSSGPGGPSHYIRLNIGTTSVGNRATAWTTATTTGSQIGNNYTATTTMTYGISPNQYILVVNWYYTAPNKYITWNYALTIPPSNNQNIRLYFGMDSYVAGGDANDVGYYGTSPSQTVGIYDNIANVLSTQRYVSGATWAWYYAGWYGTVTTTMSNNSNYPNTITSTAWDQWYWINWHFGTTPGTYSSTTEWRILPYITSNVAELSPAIGQPVPNFTVNQPSLIPVTVSNAGSLSSSGIHTILFTIPINFSGPSSAFVDNGWSCGTMNTTTRQVTCSKTTNIIGLGNDIVHIPITPLPTASGTNATFGVNFSNTSDSNTSNNTASISLQTIVSVQKRTLWVKANSGTNCIIHWCNISTWNDQSWLNRHATQSIVVNQPTYKSSDINFNPSIQFSGTPTSTGNMGFDYMNFWNQTLDITNQASVFMVWKITNNNIGNYYLWYKDGWAKFRLANWQVQSSKWMIVTPSPWVNTPFIQSSIVSDTLLHRKIQGFSWFAETIPTGNFPISGTPLWIWWTEIGWYYSYSWSIAEIIVYNTAVDIAEQERIESYLAIKYWITLNQTTPRNYVLWDNWIIWNASTAWIYKNDITGIATDIISWLTQNKSQSVNNTNDIIIEDISLPSIDKSSLMWANDGNNTGSFGLVDTPNNYERLTREWRFQEKNSDIGTIKIYYPQSGLPAWFTGTLFMFRDIDWIFGAGANTYTWVLNSGSWEFSLNINDGDYITFWKQADNIPPDITSTTIASWTLMPHGNFMVTYNYTDTGSWINPWTATGYIYSWNIGTLSYNTVALTWWYLTLENAHSTGATMKISQLPYWKYRFDFKIRDNTGNITTKSYTYFVDAVEWTVSADNYNIGNIIPNATSFGTGELVITIKTVWAGFTLNTWPTSVMWSLGWENIPAWNTSYGVGYDLWNGSAFLGNILTYSPNSTIAATTKNINTNGEKNIFIYRLKYGAKVDFMQAAWDYSWTVNFWISLHY